MSTPEPIADRAELEARLESFTYEPGEYAVTETMEPPPEPTEPPREPTETEAGGRVNLSKSK